MATKQAKKQVKKVPVKKTIAGKKTARSIESTTKKQEKIAAKNPKEKEGINISQEKYDLIRQNILSYIWRNDEVSFAQLLQDMEKKLAKSLEGSVSWHVTWVKMDLESKGILEQIPGKTPQHIRLKQRLEKPED